MAPVYYFLFYNYYSNILNFIDQQAERIKIADLDPGYFLVTVQLPQISGHEPALPWQPQ